MENIIEYSGKHRLFNNPEATKLSFQLDQNAEEKVFLFPRYLDGFDLSEFTCYLLLSGAGWTDRVELAQGTYDEETISYSWTVSALATSTGKPVVFQPVFYKEPVILHLDKDIFTISSSVDTDSEIEIYYPDYISGLNGKADKAELESFYTKTELDEKFSDIESDWQDVMNAGNLPNLLINPSGLVWQRGSSFNLTLNSDSWQYCEDRWRYKLTGSAGAAAVISKGENGGTSISIVGGGTVTRQQVLERAVTGTLSQRLNGGTVTSASFNGTVVEQTFTATTLVDWTKLEIGQIATPFSPRLFGEELSLCQRFFYTADRHQCVGSFVNGDGTKIVVGIPIPVTMRTLNPTFKETSCTANIRAAGSTYSNVALTNPNPTDIRGTALITEFNCSGLTSKANQPAAVSIMSTLSIDAEIYS